MNKYTIKYQFGPYKGQVIIWADTEEQAIALLWRNLEPSLPMAYKSARVVAVEAVNQ